MRLASILAFGALASACTTSVVGDDPPDAWVSGSDGGLVPVDSAAPPTFCDLPGTLAFTDGGGVLVGAQAAVDLSFLKLPAGFCAHYFATLGNARQMRFAPGGELFVASPTAATTGGGPGGRAAIVVLPDDDRDGFADSAEAFLGGLASTQGLLFAQGALYYQAGTAIEKVPYASGDRAPSGPSVQVADVTEYRSATHWPKTLDVADDGTIYVGNGGDQGEACDPSRPFHGGILKLDGDGGVVDVSKGFRNPINVRCQRGHDACYALELSLDYSADQGGREKVVPIHQGDDWGFPCCATRGVPYSNVVPKPDCSAIAEETNAFPIGDTPFGLDFELGLWPPGYRNSAFIALHGAFGTWTGARIVSVATDSATGALRMGGTLTSGGPDSPLDFATGWDDGTHSHGRPAAVTFAADGRLFVASDATGVIFWIAPIGLPR